MILKRQTKNAKMNNENFYFTHFNLKISSEIIIHRILYTQQYIFSYQHKLQKITKYQ